MARSSCVLIILLSMYVQYRTGADIPKDVPLSFSGGRSAFFNKSVVGFDFS